MIPAQLTQAIRRQPAPGAECAALPCWTARMLLSFALALAACGCVPEAKIEQPAGQTLTDRLRTHYPDLASGRFAVVADFEDDAQFALFRLRGISASASDLTSTTDGVAATGGRCLTALFRSSDTQLIADNQAAGDWLIKRDWRPYTLLMVSVHSPRAGLELSVDLVCGDQGDTARTDARWTLEEGWNTLRLDLGEAGQYVPLDSVRELRWSLPTTLEPVRLKIDDILLADNRESLFGDPDGAEGGLFIRRDGRRVHVGAAGRFELGFANGQIVRWYALKSDPGRGHDLVGRGNTLGPMLVRLPASDDWTTDAGWRWLTAGASGGREITARQRVVEANAVRVVVECVWSSAATGQAGDNTLARWLYALYPSGQVYVTLFNVADAVADIDANVGLAVSRLPLEDIAVELREPGRLGDTPELADRTCACFSATNEGAGLLFMLHDSGFGPRIRSVYASDAPRVSVVAFGGERAADTHTCSALLGVGPAGACGQLVNAAAARAYGGSSAIELAVGSYERATSGDAEGDGFNERVGAFMIAPEGDRVVLRVRGDEGPVLSPVFSVAAAQDRDAAVYVDQLLYGSVIRQHDRLLFQLPGLITEDMAVEVYFRAR